MARQAGQVSSSIEQRRRGAQPAPIDYDKKRRRLGNYDFTLLIMVCFLLAFGFVMLYSSTAYTATLKQGDSLYYLKRQMGASVLGFLGLAVVSAIDYHWLEHFRWPFYFTCMGLMFFAMVAGVDLNGSSRWIKLGPIQFQPSELAKIALILLYASICSRHAKGITPPKKLAVALVPGVLCAGFVALSNLSTAIIMALICVLMLYVAHRDTKPFFVLAGIGIVLMVLYIAIFSYRADRIKAWLHTEEYASTIGYQTTQGLYAIGSGGLFGKGLGNSTQKLAALPEASNDMIFAVICEELGVFGAVCVILMYIMVIFRLFYIAKRAKDRFGSFIAIGIMIHMAVQVVLHIAVVTNLFPNTGVTLPFISYGGTSIAILIAEMGLALSVSRKMEYEDSMEDDEA